MTFGFSPKVIYLGSFCLAGVRLLAITIYMTMLPRGFQKSDIAGASCRGLGV